MRRGREAGESGRACPGPRVRGDDWEVSTDGPQLRDFNPVTASEPTWDVHSVRLKSLEQQVEERPFVKEQRTPGQLAS